MGDTSSGARAAILHRRADIKGELCRVGGAVVVEQLSVLPLRRRKWCIRHSCERAGCGGFRDDDRNSTQ